MIRLHRALAACFFVCLSVVVQADELPELTKLSENHVQVSAMVVDLSRQKLLAQHQPDLRLIPASVSKLFIDAAALRRWGPDHRFTTRFVADGAVSDGVLRGDLIFVGGGDPELDHEDLWMLVARLRQAGIKRINGNLVINDSLFGPVPCTTKDRCEALEVSNNAYDALLSAAGVAFNVVEVLITPATKIGEPARLDIFPPGMTGLQLEGSIRTGTGKQRPVYGLRRRTVDGRDRLEAFGSVPLGGGPYRVYRALSDPSRQTGRILVSLMRDAGIQLGGQVTVSSAEVPYIYPTVAEIESEELIRQLRNMMEYSNNYMADVLTLNLMAYDKDAIGRVTLPMAAEYLEELANRANDYPFPWENRPAPVTPRLNIDSGSGLTVTSRVSARDVLSLLAYMYHQPDIFPAFLGTMPAAGHTHSRIFGRGTPEWKARIVAKTGTLSEPVSVFGLAGYFRMRDGGWGAFAFLTNGSEKRSIISAWKSIGAIRDDMQAILETY